KPQENAPSTAGEAPSEQPSIVTRPWSAREIIEAQAACISLLAPIVVDVKPAPPLKEGDCGAPAPVILKSLGRTNTVEMRPPVTLTCPAVAALYDWLEQTVQPAAQSQLDTVIVRLEHMGGYSCRGRMGFSEVRSSEHATANAVDVNAFVTRENRSIEVA